MAFLQDGLVRSGYVLAMQKTGQPTINDVARIAGVSKKTVSRVINRSPLLNDDTRKRVEDVIGELGYIPNPQARALALRRNFLIGLVHDNPNAQTVLNVQQGMFRDDARRPQAFSRAAAIVRRAADATGQRE
jgi:LacI family transcriptional regulator